MKILGRGIGTRRKMSCHQVGEVLQTYLDDELGERSVRKVAAHLEDCRRCGLEREVYDALKTSLRRGPEDVADGPVARLREFGERLARGELDPEELDAP